MRAVLIATGWQKGMEAMLAYRPVSLLNVVDKPLIYHVLEYLCSLGVKECDIILHHLPQQIRNKVGDGSRWGLKVTYHLCKDASYPFRAINPVIRGWKDQAVLLAVDYTLPHFTISSDHHPLKHPELVLTSSKKWTGWGVFPLQTLKGLPPNSLLNDLPDIVQKNCRFISGNVIFSVDSYLSLKKSNANAISGSYKSLNFPTTARLVEKGVWVSKGAYIHPATKVHPPVFLGEHAFIEKGCEIGPNIVVESNCIIDRLSKISDTLVCRNSYIGESLSISQSLIDKNLLVNTNLDSEISVCEDFILSEVRAKSFKSHLTNTLEKMLAISLLLLLLPLIAVVWPFSKVKSKKVISIPINDFKTENQSFNLYLWENKSGLKYPIFHSLISNIPKLINVIKGDMHFVGLPARNLDEMNSLPTTWKNLYLRSKVGIINLADVENPIDNSLDHHFVCEMYQTVNKSPFFSAKLISRWLAKKGLKR